MMRRTKNIEGEWKGFKLLSLHRGERVGAGKKRWEEERKRGGL